MATQIKLPEVAAGATHAVISTWLVAVGDRVTVGQQLAEIETDKAVVELLSEHTGTILQLIGSPGQEVEVGSVIALLGEPGESAFEDSPTEPVSEAVTDQISSATTKVPIAPPLEQVKIFSSPETGRQFVSPLARMLAKDLGVEISTLQGTGPGGRVVKQDVLAAEVSAPPSGIPPQVTSASKELAPQEFSSSYSTVPHSSMRKAIARRLTESKSTIPHFYLSANCVVDELMALRKRINEASRVKISVNDMVVRAVAAAFQDVPAANVVWTSDAMIRYESVDISIAVATNGGLLTPIIRGVEKRTLSNIAMTITDLAERSRAGKLRQDELEGGSFAITNLGMFGTESFSAIINPPQSGILAVGTARQTPVVKDGVLAIANVMSVTLSADHRAVDGALAAQWLQAFKTRIENPLSMLI